MKTTANRKHRPETSLTPAQRNTIMLICAEFGIDKEERQRLLQECYGKSSTADLTSDQAGHFIAEAERKGFVIKGSKPRPAAPRRSIPRTGNVIPLATPAELEKIDQLAKVVPWREENGLARFLEKRMGVPGGVVKTSKHAYLAVEGLKKMISNGMKKTYGEAWWLKTYSTPDLNEFIRIHKPEEWR
jgi:hypothetical protein